VSDPSFISYTSAYSYNNHCRAMEEKLELNLPEYPGSDQIVELESGAQGKM
jgi:hypothetical protein